MRRAVLPVLVSAFVVVLSATSAAAQATGATAPPAVVQPEAERSDPDVVVDPMQPEFTIGALPTTLRMPDGKWAFRVTHRFTRNLGQGDFGDLASNLFGLDGGSQIGLELRYGLRSGTQIGVHRTSDRSIQLFVQQNVLSERREHPVGLDLLATVEGADNLSEDVLSVLGVVVSKNAGRRAAVYVEPLLAVNANPFHTGDDHTLIIGLGGRLRAGRTMYLFAEYAPRVAGYRAFADQITFGFERRTGGHLFQLNVGNGFGTTLGQVARGAVAYDQWFLGFNLSRKFF